MPYASWHSGQFTRIVRQIRQTLQYLNLAKLFGPKVIPRLFHFTSTGIGVPVVG